MTRKKVAIIGGGPAGLMAADTLAPFFDVSVYDKEKTLGRKFLVAGKGGFNLTNSVQSAELIDKYLPKGTLDTCLLGFDTQALQNWLLALNIPTYIGTSGRVFPEKGIKPIDVLNNIKQGVLAQGVQFYTEHTFTGFNAQHQPIIKHKEESFPIEADYCVFALGGASWPVTGSNGIWREAFEAIGVITLPFQSSNCGVNVQWPLHLQQYAGKPLKNIAISVNEKTIKGEALITEYGLEGNAIYPVIPAIREALNRDSQASLLIDLKPNNTIEELLQKTKGNTLKPKEYANVFNLSALQLAILKAYTSKETYVNANSFVHSLKSISIPVVSLRPLEEAISTVGGIAFDQLNPDFSLKQYPNLFITGEMMDWDAPTGGFLLQACFSTAHYAAKSIIVKT